MFSDSVTVDSLSPSLYYTNVYITEQCGGSPLIDGLNITLTSNGTTTFASFLCDVNYTLVGVLNATCLTTAAWDPATPNCGMSCDTSNVIRSLLNI